MMLTFANTIAGNGRPPRKRKELIKEKTIGEEISDFGSYALRSGTTKKSEITRAKFWPPHLYLLLLLTQTYF